MWRLSQDAVDLSYCVCDIGGNSVLVPGKDSRPHNLIGPCECKPEVILADNHYHITHNRFEDLDAINDSVKKLFG